MKTEEFTCKFRNGEWVKYSDGYGFPKRAPGRIVGVKISYRVERVDGVMSTYREQDLVRVRRQTKRRRSNEQPDN